MQHLKKALVLVANERQGVWKATQVLLIDALVWVAAAICGSVKPRDRLLSILGKGIQISQDLRSRFCLAYYKCFFGTIPRWRGKRRKKKPQSENAVEEQVVDFTERSHTEEEAQQPRVGEGRKALAPPQGPASSNAELPAMPKDVAPALPTIREAVAASTGAAAQSQAQLPVPPVEASSPAAETPVETAGPTAEGPAAAEAPVETAGPTAEGPAAEAPVETAGPTAEGPAAESLVEAAGPSPVEAAGPPPASMWYQTQPAAKAQARLDEEEVRKEWQKELAAVKLEEEGGRAGPSALAPTQGQSSEAQSQRRAKASRWVSPLTTGTPGSSSIIRSKRDRLLVKIWSAKRSSTPVLLQTHRVRACLKQKTNTCIANPFQRVVDGCLCVHAGQL